MQNTHSAYVGVCTRLFYLSKF